jgi:serine phosphatase RsbU (regulator of sigma subunit)
MLLADVTGHGASAALISSMLKASFQRAVAGGSAGPEDILQRDSTAT